MTKYDVRVFADLDAVADAACAHVCNRAWAAVQARGRFTLALSGGSTPRALYKRLALHPELPWDHIELCFGDERAVPPDDPSSNARMVAEALTQHGFVPAGRVHRMHGELPAVAAAASYAQTLRSVFGQSAGFPRFDLVLLGLGPDGHTASLFPHTAALCEDKAWVVASPGKNPETERITVTFPVLNAAAEVLFLVAGADKRWALSQVLQGTSEISDIPARGVRPADGSVTFLVDRAAAGPASAG